MKNIIKYLGIDWGTKRIGLAAADSETRLAGPLGVAKDMAETLALVRKEDIDEIVIGAPLRMHGDNYELNKIFERFKNDLRRKSGLPVHLFDERLSSKAADALPGDTRSKAPRDAVAAMIILQNWLDCQPK